MKKIITITMLVTLLINCQSKKYLQEVTSDKYITISFPYEEKALKDNLLTFNVPIEFEVNINPKKTRGTTFYYIRNGEGTSRYGGYLICNGESDLPLFKKGQWEDGEYYPKTIYLIDETIYINKEKAKSLLEKYNNSTTLEKLKSYQDTIKLVPYSQFRKDFPAFIEEMRKEPDSLKIVISIKGRKENIVVKERINW